MRQLPRARISGDPTPTRVSPHEGWSISTAQLSPNPLPQFGGRVLANEKGGAVLGVGIDWAEDANQVAFGRPGEMRPC